MSHLAQAFGVLHKTMVNKKHNRATNSFSRQDQREEDDRIHRTDFRSLDYRQKDAISHSNEDEYLNTKLNVQYTELFDLRHVVTCGCTRAPVKQNS